MAKNYTVDFIAYGSYLYKNSNVDNLPVKTEALPYVYYNYFDIANINNIDLSQFEVFYGKNDTERQHPIYRKIVANEEWIAADTTAAAYKNKLDLGDNKIIFFALDQEEYNIGLTSAEDAATLDKERYGLVAPIQLHDFTDSHIEYGIEGRRQYDTSNVTDFSLVKNSVIGTIKGIGSYKDPNKDAWVIGIGGEISHNGNNYITNFNMVGDNNYAWLDTWSISTPASLELTSEGTRYGFYNLFPSTGGKLTNGSTTRNYHILYPDTRYTSASDMPTKLWYVKNANSNNIWRPAGFAFLMDDNKELYVLSAAIAPTNFKHSVEFMIYKVDIMGLNNLYAMSADQTQSANIIVNETDKAFINDVFDKVILRKREVSDYDSDAPDLPEGSDPYEDLDNSLEGQVGGNPNTDPPPLEEDAATPNDGYANVGLSTGGLYGTYQLSTNNLENYAKTLAMLYDHSTDILWGLVTEKAADHITNNTVDIKLLPVNVPADNHINRIFAVGNEGISATQNWDEYKNGNDYDNALYITNNIFSYPIDLGIIAHREDNFLDFEPYSKASIYIPYIGTQDIPLNFIQSTSTETKRLKMEFRFDVTTGDFVAILFVNDIPMTHYTGNCAKEIRINVDDDSAAVKQAIRGITSVVMAGAASGISAPMLPKGKKITKKYAKAASEGIENQLSNITDAATQSYPSHSHQVGNMPTNGVLGWLDSQKVYITVERPIVWRPKDYGDYIGYPTKKLAKLSSASGYINVPEIHLKCSATIEERDEIRRLLAGGVII